MTKQEMKDEHKQTEGSPELQGRAPPPPAGNRPQLGPQGDGGGDRRAHQPDPFRGGAALPAGRSTPRRSCSPRAAAPPPRRSASLPASTTCRCFPTRSSPARSITLAAGPDHPRGSLHGGGDRPRLRLQPRRRRWPSGQAQPAVEVPPACASTRAACRRLKPYDPGRYPFMKGRRGTVRPGPETQRSPSPRSSGCSRGAPRGRCRAGLARAARPRIARGGAGQRRARRPSPAASCPTPGVAGRAGQYRCRRAAQPEALISGVFDRLKKPPLRPFFERNGRTLP